MQDHHLAFERSVMLDMENAPLWSAPYPDPDHVIDLTGLFSRIQFLFSHLDHSQARGFGVFIPHLLCLSRGMDADSLPEPADPILHFARPFILDMARACLQGRSTLIAQSADRLIGLGSGLTPSGDDFLGGLFFTLTTLQVAYPDLFQTADILPIETYRSQTHLISFTLLKDLAGGHAVAPLHSLMLGILGGGALDDILPAVNQLTGIGHSTGWDLLTGMLAGFLLTAPGIHLIPSRKSHNLEVWKGIDMDIKQKIEKANEEAVRRLTSGEPVLVDIAPAGEVIPGMKDKMITHAGPPIEWNRMCGAHAGRHYRDGHLRRLGKDSR